LKLSGTILYPNEYTVTSVLLSDLSGRFGHCKHFKWRTAFNIPYGDFLSY